MSNPWLKKNPLMSMWLSAANRMAASLRGQASAEAKRQITAAVNQASRENLKIWSDAAGIAAQPRPKRKR